MRKLLVFNNMSLDGYFVDGKGDMSWAHQQKEDAEWNAFVSGNAKGGGLLLFGRVTYDLMAGYWPSPMALERDRVVAEQMNSLPKMVFSKKMDKAAWSNTTLIKSNLVEEVRKMKNEPGPDMVIFGSGTIVWQLAQEGLIDEYQLVVIPVVLGSGRTMFEGVKNKISLKLINTRAFNNGNVLLCYEPIA